MKKNGVFIIDLFAFLVIIIAAIFLFANRNYFSVPDPDFFQYIEDGRQYMQLKLPGNIQMPPVFSILICSVGVFLHTHMYPELLAAHMINIIAAILTLIFIYLSIRPYSRSIGFITVLLVATNPLFIFCSLNLNSEVLFTTFAIMTFYFYQAGLTGWAYSIAGFSFLVRYEGGLLLLSMIIIDLLKHRGVQKIFRQNLLPLGIIIGWIVVIYRQNALGSIIGNTYIQEILQRRQNVPEFILIARLPHILIDYLRTKMGETMSLLSSIFLYAGIVVGAVFLILHKNLKIAFITFFTLLYLIFHVFFPYGPDRYAYPVLWSLYLMAIVGIGFWVQGTKYQWKVARVIKVFSALSFMIAICLIIGNIFKTKEYYQNTTATNVAFYRYYRHEVRLAADWLNTQTFNKPVVVFTYDPWILSYYTLNRDVICLNLPYKLYQQCDSIECVIKSTNITTDTSHILFVQVSNSFLTDETFPSATNMNVKIFNNFPNNEEKNDFVLLKRLSLYDSWTAIYEYLPGK